MSVGRYRLSQVEEYFTVPWNIIVFYIGRGRGYWIWCWKWKRLFLVRMSRIFGVFLAPKKCTSLPVEKIGFEERFSNNFCEN